MIALILALGLQSTAHASTTTLLLVTDEPKAVKAREVAALFRSTKPFSLMNDLKIKVIQTTPAKLGCQSAPQTDSDVNEEGDSDSLLSRTEWRENDGAQLTLPHSCTNRDTPPISRLISCDTPQATAYLGALEKTERAKKIIVVKTDSRYGGSGGVHPVITSASPASMAIHELMHQLGFADEYEYSNACEADIYCSNDASEDYKSPSGYGCAPGTSFNIAAFNARATYASNADVRKSHGKQIPWLAYINKKTNLVSNGKLGSPVQPGVIALYSTSVCNRASDRHDTWVSTAQDTIMKTLATTFIPKDYWPTIAKSLGTKITY